MPDGRSYFWVAKTTAPEGRGYLGQHKSFAIGLGCDLAYADRLVYSTGVVLDDPTTAVPIGAGCKICNRKSCTQRAFPYLGAAWWWTRTPAAACPIHPPINRSELPMKSGRTRR